MVISVGDGGEGIATGRWRGGLAFCSATFHLFSSLTTDGKMVANPGSGLFQMEGRKKPGPHSFFFGEVLQQFVDLIEQVLYLLPLRDGLAKRGLKGLLLITGKSFQ